MPPQPKSQATAAKLIVGAPWTGDLDEMIKRRLIRVLVTYNKTTYFIDKGVQRGIAYDAFRLFEDQLNAKLKTGNLKVHVVFIPVRTCGHPVSTSSASQLSAIRS